MKYFSISEGDTRKCVVRRNIAFPPQFLPLLKWNVVILSKINSGVVSFTSQVQMKVNELSLVKLKMKMRYSWSEGVSCCRVQGGDWLPNCMLCSAGNVGAGHQTGVISFKLGVWGRSNTGNMVRARQLPGPHTSPSDTPGMVILAGNTGFWEYLLRLL